MPQISVKCWTKLKCRCWTLAKNWPINFYINEFLLCVLGKSLVCVLIITLKWDKVRGWVWPYWGVPTCVIITIGQESKKKKRYTWRKNSDRIYLHRVRGKGELKDKEKEVIGLLLLDDICLTLDSYPCLRTFRSIRVESGKLQLLPSICLWVLPTESASHCSSYFFISNMLLKFIEIKIQGIW